MNENYRKNEKLQTHKSLEEANVFHLNKSFNKNLDFYVKFLNKLFKRKKKYLNKQKFDT